MTTPVLQTERLILRPFRTGDAEEVFACWESDPAVSKYMFWTSHNDIAKTREWLADEISKIDSDDWFRWAVELRDSHRLVGTCLIYFESEYGAYEIGYNLGRRYWGRGYATEAMGAVVGFAKHELKLTKLVARYAKENAASGGVLSKLGFEYARDIPFETNDGAALYVGEECWLSL